MFNKCNVKQSESPFDILLRRTKQILWRESESLFDIFWRRTKQILWRGGLRQRLAIAGEPFKNTSAYCCHRQRYFHRQQEKGKGSKISVGHCWKRKGKPSKYKSWKTQSFKSVVDKLDYVNNHKNISLMSPGLHRMLLFKLSKSLHANMLYGLTLFTYSFNTVSNELLWKILQPKMP